MCCEPRGRHHGGSAHHGAFGHHGSDGCCCGHGPGHHFRRHVSRRERIERLEAYREELKNELDGVDEAIQELKEG